MPQVRLRFFFKLISHMCAKMECAMAALLLLIPVGLFCASRSSLWRVLRALPSSNEDFVIF
jgi:hypothetical protein